MKATARAHPNLALVKYWGKRDDALILPHQSSLSMTLSPLAVRTTVAFGEGSADEVELNGYVAKGSERDRVLRVLDAVRAEVKGRELGPAKMVSRGDFPASAGLASSAAGFAALAVAARAAAGLPADPKAASILSRLGSGSACRSVQGGFCEWMRGERPDGTDSYAVQRFDEKHWPQLRMVVAIVSRDEKEVKSRDGMKNAVETSPYYPAWVKDAEAEVVRAREFLAKKDLQALGEMCERNAWRMHATSLAADPPLCYLMPKTLELIHSLREQRKKGVPVWFTLDAGPNPCILTDAANEVAAEAVARACGATEVVRCVPGGDAVLLTEHLF
ncbi:diphosphomevalonate decarboxylase [Archangium violaceum]|uniref:diphosphomevalonate decarboxylase n=1 Tax=Archangium violaceum TaxID=83451 RepID=UPI00193B3370|nr:diphosphomevalonate decarboxylase [Archangium violaceum]QRK05037.1 diphosphomevalonate decarboxylase [Archangium violaceum]